MGSYWVCPIDPFAGQQGKKGRPNIYMRLSSSYILVGPQPDGL
jgi:hypothetical protein